MSHKSPDELYKENTYYNLLHETALSLMNRLDLDDLLLDIVNRACDIMGTQHGFVYLIEPESNLLEVKVGIGLYQKYIGAKREKGKALSGAVWAKGEPIAVEDYCNWPGRADKNERPYGWNIIKSLMGVPLKIEGQVIGIIGLGFNETKKFTHEDITNLERFAALASIALDNVKLYNALQSELEERKRYEEKLKYLNTHDELTGLFNRTYIDKYINFDKQELPFSIVICDLDGLKITNDTLGHHAGDQLIVKVADVLKKSTRKNDVVARMGGDEFIAFLNKTSEKEANDLCQRVRDAWERSKGSHYIYNLSVSLGVATSDGSKTIADLIKEADCNMYREKLHHKASARSTMVQFLRKAMETRGFVRKGKVERLQALAVRMAKATNLLNHKTADLILLIQFHDIGMVGVPDKILFKKGPLNDIERNQMQRHCEIGYRIAMTAPDLVPIADWILHHHEWWNGKGYPFRLKKESIPLECRIFSILDAYDAMTNDRPYRKALSRQEAIAELNRCSGIQFDAQLVSVFMQILTP